MTQLSCLLIGEETLVIGCGEALLARGHRIAGLVSRNDKVRAWARQARIALASDVDKIAALESEQAVDWLLSIANAAPIPEAARAIPTRGTINFHDGPLPDYAGHNTPVWALMAGAPQHGVTWHLVEGTKDEGDILFRKDFDIAADETAFTLNAKCYAAGLEGFDAVLTQLEADRLDRQRQNPARRRYFKPSARPEAAGRLDFTRSAAEVTRIVRALDFGGYWNPLAMPKIKAGGRLLLVRQAKTVETVTPAAPGTVLNVTKTTITVATRDGAVRLSGFSDMAGHPVELYTGVLEGAVLASPDAAQAEALKTALSALARTEARWRDRLAAFRPAHLALAQRPRGLASWSERHFTGPKGLDPTRELAALVAWALHNTGDWGAGLVYASAGIEAAARAAPGYMNPWVPLTLTLEEPATAPVAVLAEALADDLAAAEHGSFAPDLIARDPGLGVIEMPSIGISRGGPVEGTALTLSLQPGNITLWHDARLIEDEAMALLGDRLALFLDNLAAKPDAPVRELLVLPATERALTVVEWNRTRTDTYLGPIHKAFEAQVDRTPDATALVFNDLSMSYRELDTRANALAHRLIDEGARPGDRIGIYLSRSFELMIAAIAIHKVGAAYVPLDPAYPADRLVHYVTDSAATFVVTNVALAPSLPKSDAVPVMVAGAGEATDRPEVDIPDDALAYVIYTSGSTGIPKGVQVEHRNVSNFFTGMDAYLDGGPGGVWLAVTSLGFDISVLELFYTITRGDKVVIVSEESRVTLSDGGVGEADYSLSAQLTRHKATVLQCTPSMGRMILADEGARAALGQLKQILLGGEAVTASLTADIRSISSAQIIDMYGPTETTIWSTAHPVQGNETGVVPVGRPMANQTVYVLDAAMQPVPIGLPGELWIGGLGVTRGYWQRDELNADRFRRDPFADETGVRRYEQARMYGTGDLVRWRADGVLDFLGRTDHQVKIRGQRLELGEIEARINRAEGVRQAVVVPKGEGAETRLVAYVEQAGAIDIAGVRADLVANLPEVMVPSQFVVLDALPLTPNRKVDRKALPEPEPEARLERSASDGPAPGAGLEQQISAIWTQALGIDDIRADDSFFALGGHSLLAVRVHKEIKALPGLEGTAITEIFRFPVLRDIAAHLTAKNGLAAPDAAPSGPIVLPEFDRTAIMARRAELRAKRAQVAA